MTDNDIKIINNTITSLLARREHSRKELLNKLSSKGLATQLCIEQLDKFTQQNIQSDRRFAEMLIRSKAHKGYGPNRIRMELSEYGVDSATAKDAFDELAIDWFELAEKVILKKYADQAPSDWKALQKRQRFMQYRGFDSEQTKHALQIMSGGD